MKKLEHPDGPSPSEALLGTSLAPGRSAWRSVEPMIWIALIALLSGLIFVEGRKRQALEAALGVPPAELYQKIARAKVRPQIVDVRSAEEFEEAHIPGAIPFPACDGAAASEWILASVPTVIVSADGDPAVLAKCGSYFTMVRNLAGGMAAWSDESYPESDGEYLPPLASAGGGCL